MILMNDWLLAIACVLVNLFAIAVTVLLLRVRKKRNQAGLMREEALVALEAGEEAHRVQCAAYEAESAKLTESLQAAETLCAKRQALLELLAQAHTQQGGRVGVFAFDVAGGELLPGACDRELEALLTGDGVYPLHSTLARMAESTVPIAMEDKYLTVTRTATEEAEVFVVTDVTDTCRVPVLERRCEEIKQDVNTRDPFTQVTITYDAFVEAQQKTFEDGNRLNAWVLLLKTETAHLSDEIMGTYQESYTTACAEILAAELGSRNVSRNAELSFVGMFDAESGEAAEALAEKISAAITEKRKELWPADDRFIVRHVLVLASFAGVELENFVYCLDVTARRNILKGKFGVKVFPRTSYPLIMGYKNHIEQTLATRKVRFFYRPIADSTNARVLGYEMLPFFPALPFKSAEEMLEWGRLLGYANRLEELVCTEGMRVYSKAVDNAIWLGSTRVLMHSLEGACMVKKAEEDFHERHYDLLSNMIVELEEKLPEERVVAEMKRSNLEKWGAGCIVRCTDDILDNGLRVGFLHPQMARISADVLKNSKQKEQMAHFIARIHEDGGKVLVDGITLPSEVDTAIAAGADYLQGEYVGKTADAPGTLTDRCMRKIGLIHFGKKG